MTRLLANVLGVALATTVVAGAAGGALAQDKFTITLVPGLTTDAFYITMRKGAESAAEALGVDFSFQGAPNFNPTEQIPVLEAVIAQGPDAILIAPTDKTQLIEPLRQATAAGILVLTVDTFIDDGSYQDGAGPGDFPLALISSDNVLGGRMAARALCESIGGSGKVYVANVNPGISTTDQREEGFKLQMAATCEGVDVLETQFNEDDSAIAATQLQAVLAREPDLAGVFGANLFSAIGAADGVRASGKSGEIKVAAFDAPQRIVEDLKTGLVDVAIAQHPAEIGWFGVATAFAALSGQSVPTLIGTGFTIMGPDNIDDPDIAAFVYAD
jgi:ribose transport system substrate-binding protein